MDDTTKATIASALFDAVGEANPQMVDDFLLNLSAHGVKVTAPRSPQPDPLDRRSNPTHCPECRRNLGGRAMGPHVRPDTFEPCIAGADAVFLPKSIIAALEAHAPIPRRHRDGTPSTEPGDTICRWCRVNAGIDHDEDCAITVARHAVGDR